MPLLYEVEKNRSCPRASKVLDLTGLVEAERTNRRLGASRRSLLSCLEPPAKRGDGRPAAEEREGSNRLRPSSRFSLAVH